EHHEMHAQVTDNDKKIRKLATDEAKKTDQKKEAKQAAAKEPNKEHEHGAGHDDALHELREENEKLESEFEKRWSDSVIWASLYYRDVNQNKRPQHIKDVESGTALQLGYRIDHLSAIMFVMVTFIASLIHLFSIGYMSEELGKSVVDHEVHTDHGHLHRRGR